VAHDRVPLIGKIIIIMMMIGVAVGMPTMARKTVRAGDAVGTQLDQRLSHAQVS
jgi:hypothetical protein